jgi:hypothetical protein
VLGVLSLVATIGAIRLRDPGIGHSEVEELGLEDRPAG